MRGFSRLFSLSVLCFVVFWFQCEGWSSRGLSKSLVSGYRRQHVSERVVSVCERVGMRRSPFISSSLGRKLHATDRDLILDVDSEDRHTAIIADAMAEMARITHSLSLSADEQSVKGTPSPVQQCVCVLQRVAEQSTPEVARTVWERVLRRQSIQAEIERRFVAEAVDLAARAMRGEEIASVSPSLRDTLCAEAVIDVLLTKFNKERDNPYLIVFAQLVRSLVAPESKLARLSCDGLSAALSVCLLSKSDYTKRALELLRAFHAQFNDLELYRCIFLFLQAHTEDAAVLPVAREVRRFLKAYSREINLKLMNAFLRVAVLHGTETDCLEVLEALDRSGVKNDQETLELLVLRAVVEDNPQWAKLLWKEMRSQGFQLSETTFVRMLSLFRAHKDIQTVENIALSLLSHIDDGLSPSSLLFDELLAFKKEREEYASDTSSCVKILLTAIVVKHDDKDDTDDDKSHFTLEKRFALCDTVPEIVRVFSRLNARDNTTNLAVYSAMIDRLSEIGAHQEADQITQRILSNRRWLLDEALVHSLLDAMLPRVCAPGISLADAVKLWNTLLRCVYPLCASANKSSSLAIEERERLLEAAQSTRQPLLAMQLQRFVFRDGEDVDPSLVAQLHDQLSASSSPLSALSLVTRGDYNESKPGDCPWRIAAVDLSNKTSFVASNSSENFYAKDDLMLAGKLENSAMTLEALRQQLLAFYSFLGIDVSMNDT